jgi:hypothetical protein
MKKGGGSGKGGAFERKIAKRLSLWLTNGTDSSQLVRSVLSGGWGGNKAARHSGDLAANGEAGERFRNRFVVECKHYKVIDLWDCLTCAPGQNIVGWWTKLVKEADDNDRHPLLIYRTNFRPIMVGLRIGDVCAPQDTLIMEIPRYSLATFPLDIFLETPPDKYL